MSQAGTQNYVLVPINQIAVEIKVVVVDRSIYATIRGGEK